MTRQPAHMTRLAKIEDRIALVTGPLRRRLLAQGFDVAVVRAEVAAAGDAIYQAAVDNGEI